MDNPECSNCENGEICRWLLLAIQNSKSNLRVCMANNLKDDAGRYLRETQDLLRHYDEIRLKKCMK